MLRIEHVSKSYDRNKKAVDDLSIHVKKGEIYGFIGPNGAGKTTTIKMITGILKMSSGNIFIDGINIASNPIEAKRRMTYVPDNPDIQKKLKGIEYVNFIADMYDISKADRQERTNEYAKLFGMQDALYNQIASYSHEMCIRDRYLCFCICDLHIQDLKNILGIRLYQERCIYFG